MKASDSVLLEITCADIAAVLRQIGNHGIVIRDIRNIDFLTVQVQCSAKDARKIHSLVKKYGGSIKTLNEQTLWVFFQKLKKRPLIVLAFILLIILVVYLPTRVLFIRVDGNHTVPANQILEAAETCGIRFGASRRLVRSEKMKNALLGQMPQLQWAGINTSGCVATISVRERSAEEPNAKLTGVGSIVSDRDGIIQSCTVQNGTALCRPGEAVTAGQTLVSGYTDCGIAIKAVRAEAEIKAYTARRITAIAPVPIQVRDGKIREETKYSLLIGKKLINFYKDSGISDTTCVKMYSEYYLTLPGGFRLPVALVTQRTVYYSSAMQMAVNAEDWLAGFCRGYLLRHMQAGQILMESIQLQQENDVCFLYGEYTCLETIGQFIDEEIVNNDGQTN